MSKCKKREKKHDFLRENKRLELSVEVSCTALCFYLLSLSILPLSHVLMDDLGFFFKGNDYSQCCYSPYLIDLPKLSLKSRDTVR